jgi:hypothetical protein
LGRPTGHTLQAFYAAKAGVKKAIRCCPAQGQVGYKYGALLGAVNTPFKNHIVYYIFTNKKYFIGLR